MANQYTSGAIKRRPLTDAQLRALIKTHPDEWLVVFQGASRDFLRRERQRGLKKFPPETVVETTGRGKLPYTPPEAERLPLTDDQLKVLLSTHPDEWPRVFPGGGETWLRGERKRAIEKFPPEIVVEMDKAAATERTAARDMERRYRAALDENKRLADALEMAQRMPAVAPRAVRITSKPGAREATAVALASDWHAEEPVDPENVNGLNDYNVEVFRARAANFFANTLALIKKESQAITIRNLVLWLGGDFISNSIHEDLAESNELGPVPAIKLVQDTIAGGIRHLLAGMPKDFRITVPCSSGNHGRMTQERRIQTEADNSLEAYMYSNLADHFRNEPRVSFTINKGYHTYVDVHGYMLRFHHGHNIGYSGGIGGITIPVNKKIAQWNKARPAYLDLFGHFHQFFDGGSFVCNGSLIGYNEFAIAIGASYEPPRQAFFLVDAQHGKTVVAPILLEPA